MRATIVVIKWGQRLVLQAGDFVLYRRQFPRSVAVSTQIHQRGRGWRVSASDIRFGWPPISNGGGLIYGFMVRYGSRQAHEHDAAGLNLLVDLDYLAAPTPSTGPQGGRH